MKYFLAFWLALIAWPAFAGAPMYVAARVDGGDDAPAINAALLASCSVMLGSENYHQAVLITVPSNCLLDGQGRSTKITKIANGDMVDLKQGSEIHNITLDGNGTLFTGRGIVIRLGENHQRIINTHINANGYPVEVEAPDAGSHMKIEDCFINRWPSLSSYSIKLPDDTLVTGGERTIRNVLSSGGGGVDIAGAYNTILDRVNMAYIRMSAGSKALTVVYSRIGYVEWYGHSHVVIGNNVAQQSFVTPLLYQSLFEWNPSNVPLYRQDLDAQAVDVINRGNVVR